MFRRKYGLIVSVVAVSTLVALAGWLLRPRIHPGFMHSFIELNRHSDDFPTSVAYDAPGHVLAVGRESGRLELWDVRRIGARRLLQAHSMRTQHLAFGTRDQIVFSTSEIDDVTKVWNIHSGKLLCTLKGVRGPVAPAPSPGWYVAGDDGHVVVYDHARCALVGTPVPVSGRTVTALDSDPESGLVALGTSGGGLRVMRWDFADGAPQLRLLQQSHPYASGNWIQAARLVDHGRGLISVSRTGEVVEWNSATLERRRLFPTTLRGVYQASFVPGEPWLVLSGTLSAQSDDGKVEVLNLRTGVALRYKANTNLPVSTLLPEAFFGLILQSGSVKGIRYLDE
ncbi:MAG: hypothetical protein ABI268_13220 [Rhodanobacter sp.]